MITIWKIFYPRELSSDRKRMFCDPLRQKLDIYLHCYSIDHRPLTYILSSPMENRLIQLWALGIPGYISRIEYVPGIKHTVADLLSRSPMRFETVENSDNDPDVNDRTFEIHVLDSNKFQPKTFVRSHVDNETDPVIPPVLNKDIVVEQELHPKIVSIKEKLRNVKSSKKC